MCFAADDEDTFAWQSNNGLLSAGMLQRSFLFPGLIALQRILSRVHVTSAGQSALTGE